MTVRTDLLGVSSTARALGLKQKYYVRLLNSFHSSGIKLGAMTRLWAQVVLQHFPGVLRVGGRLVLVGDGIKRVRLFCDDASGHHLTHLRWPRCFELGCRRRGTRGMRPDLYRAT